MKNSNTPTEHIEQALLFKWATFSSGKYPELEYMFAIPNGAIATIELPQILSLRA